MKKCPFCGQDIEEKAVKCPLCGEFLKDKLREIVGKKPKWYFKTSTLIIGFLFIGPFIIPLVWFNPHYSKIRKFLLTAVLAIVSALMFWSAKESLESIGRLYQELQNIGLH